MRPLIGVSKPDKGGLVQNLAIRFALWISGARSVSISPSNSEKAYDFDGLVLSGGTDISPHLFNSSEVKQNYLYDSKRDELELKLLKYAKTRNLPILCICRGAQLLNIYEGGTLFTNISRVFENADYPSSLWAKIFFRKKIIVDENSKLSDAFGTGEAEVNSMHSQSINQVGDDLEVTSEEKNGIIQSVEHAEKQHIIGVQFHPEFLIYRKDARELFLQFVKAC